MRRKAIEAGYASPRWSQEITDCSMPMTLDTYSSCSYRCLYCFSFFQKSIGLSRDDYIKSKTRCVNVEKVKATILGTVKVKAFQQFVPFTKQRLAIQWGGLADQFDENERQYGISLKLLRFFREIKYPVSMSTKATWWTEDERYVELFRKAKHFNLKISIITLDEEKARRVEVLCPTPMERLRAIEKAAKWGIGGVTLRLRPLIIGISTPSYLELIKRARDMGAEAVSTEFLCVEQRAKMAKPRWEVIGRHAGYDLMKLYRKNSPGQTGYLRLVREVKRPFMEKMKELCDKIGMRFYVSDAHFKELCHNGSCCGLRPKWNYSRAHFTEALLIAKKKGEVRWSDIEKGLDFCDGFLFRQAEGFNTNSAEVRSQFYTSSLKDWIHYQWNNVNGGKGPYKYFGGVLVPKGKDENGDVIYEYKER